MASNWDEIEEPCGPSRAALKGLAAAADLLERSILAQEIFVIVNEHKGETSRRAARGRIVNFTRALAKYRKQSQKESR